MINLDIVTAQDGTFQVIECTTSGKKILREGLKTYAEAVEARKTVLDRKRLLG